MNDVPVIKTSIQLREATSDELRALLHQGTVQFAYQKVGGALRIARGTLDLNKIPKHSQPDGTKEMKVNPDQVRYWDLTKEGWRSTGVGVQIFINDPNTP